ncbi:MAG: cytochrome b [bacterium]
MADNIGDRVADWIGGRIDLEWLIDRLIKKKTVPIHRHSIWYYCGGMTLFFFSVQVVTGILLLLYYRPTPTEAFESVKFIMTQVRFGWLIRSIHAWSANLMIASLFVHMFSAFLMKAYRPPRELTWVVGVLLLFTTLAFGFSGYLLPWNDLSFFATKVGTQIAGSIPFVGRYILILLRGGEEVTGATLTRFFGFHVAVLPMVITVILAVHLALIQFQGMSIPPSVMEREKNIKEMPFFPNFLLRDIMGWFVALAILVAIASLFPWGLGEKADPFAPAPAGIKPEWYFLFMFQTLKYIPGKILSLDGEMLGVVGFAMGAVFWLLVPFLDVWSAKGRRSPLFTAIGIAIIAYIAIMTALSLLEPSQR